MSIYAIGDLHLSFDENIDKPMNIFGDAWTDHEQKLKDNWEKIVTEEDIVLILGDISWAMKLEEAMADLNWIDNLPGKKVIIKGNHDLWWNGINKLNSLFNTITFMQNTSYIIPHSNMAICGSRGWISPGSEGFTDADEKIYKREILRLETSLKSAKEQDINHIIGILHYPPTNEKKQPSGFTALFEQYGVEKVYYGHLHGNDAIKNKNSYNLNGVSYQLVSLDATNCKLIKVI